MTVNIRPYTLQKVQIMHCVSMTYKVVIYKFCKRSKYAHIRFDNVSYGEAARGVLSAQNFPTYESV